MRRLAWIVRGVSNTINRGARDAEIDEERAFHVAARADDLARQGLTRDEALRQAHLEFGGAARSREECRDAGRFTLLEDLARDLQYAWRSLRRSPGLIAVSVLSLALGIGVNTTLFSGVAAVFLTYPTARELDRLVWVDPGNSNQWSYPNYRDLRASGIFDDVAGYRAARLGVRRPAQPGPDSVRGTAVTPNFFHVLGVSAQIGRTFTDQDIGTDPVPHLAVLSYGFWSRRFAKDPAVVSQAVILNGEPFVVLGILPQSYRSVDLLTDPDVYVPVSSLVLTGLDNRRNLNALNVIGRLRTGTGREQAQAAVTALGRELERLYPEENHDMSRPAQLGSVGRLQLASAPLAAKVFPPILALLCGLVLLIACANVAGLLLARATGRQRELAMQSALGASRLRLVRALLAESLVLTLLGAGLGVFISVRLMPIVGNLALPIVGAVHIPMRVSWPLIAYAGLLMLLTAGICGLLPALRATRSDLRRQFQQGGHPGVTAPLRLRNAMVVGEVAASVVLLVIALLFLRTLSRLTAVNGGADLDHAIVATIELPPNRYTNEGLQSMTTALLERIDATPGIASSSLADILPLAMDSSAARFEPEDRRPPGIRTFVNSVAPRYFETMGIPVLRGRDFRSADRAGAPPVVIVSQAFANAYFPGDDPIGKRVRAVDREPFAEIVGVVKDTAYQFLSESPRPLLYYAFAQRAVSTQTRPLRILARTSGSPIGMVRTIEAIVAEPRRDAVVRVTTLRDATSFELDLRRAGSMLLGTLGTTGLFLAMVGLFGVVSYVVASSIPEFGIRAALGASPVSLMRTVLWRGMRLTGWGLALGVAISVAAARLLAAFLAGLSPVDPIAFAGAAIILGLVALFATYLPAKRAARVDPMIALREP